MSELVKTFAELLRQFSLSVDIVDQGTSTEFATTSSTT
jgi:hypothetical protein